MQEQGNGGQSYSADPGINRTANLVDDPEKPCNKTTDFLIADASIR